MCPSFYEFCLLYKVQRLLQLQLQLSPLPPLLKLRRIK
jgi:hypothetical protein